MIIVDLVDWRTARWDAAQLQARHRRKGFQSRVFPTQYSDPLSWRIISLGRNYLGVVNPSTSAQATRIDSRPSALYRGANSAPMYRWSNRSKEQSMGTRLESTDDHPFYIEERINKYIILLLCTVEATDSRNKSMGTVIVICKIPVSYTVVNDLSQRRT